ncbi:MAG: CHASE3 domain-containing protein, partial [Bacteroidia bacterium]
MQQESNTNIVRNLFIVFFISTLLLLISIIGSVTCINELIDSSQWVNHTNEVLFETEGLISGIKDAETAQRGYVITGRADYLELYNPSYTRVKASISKIKFLTSDNLSQQERIAALTPLVEERFRQMDRVLELYSKAVPDKEGIDAEMQRGRQLMMRLRAVVDEIKGEENRLLVIRIKKLEVYVKYTPALIILAALLSIAITIISFIRIKKETEDRLKKQKEDEQLYRETSERITQMEIITQRISAGDLYARAEEDKQDELGRVSGAINKMTISLQRSFLDLENKSWLESKAVEIN